VWSTVANRGVIDCWAAMSYGSLEVRGGCIAECGGSSRVQWHFLGVRWHFDEAVVAAMVVL